MMQKGGRTQSVEPKKKKKKNQKKTPKKQKNLKSRSALR